jgi:hypothetical protein
VVALSGTCSGAAHRTVADLGGIQMLQKFATRHRRAAVLLYEGSCQTTKMFQPWLFALAQFVPQIPIAQVDVSMDGGTIKETFGVASLPQLKIFAKDNPKGQRIIDYTGPFEFESLMGWFKAILAGERHALSVYGSEPPEPEPETSSSVVLDGGKDSNRQTSTNHMDSVPESVRNMAVTMVRESRLQRILKEQGGGVLDRYNSMVASRYMQIIKDESIGQEDKFGIQEANRRAREEVRDTILEEAPGYVREEIESEVHLGDMAAQAVATGQQAD